VTAGALPLTLFLPWFEVEGAGRSSGWESFHRIDLILVAVSAIVMASSALRRSTGAGLARSVLAAAALALIARELLDPPAGSGASVLFGGEAALAIACFLLAVTVVDLIDRSPAHGSTARRGLVVGLACLGVFGAALTVRVSDLKSTPPGLYQDEAMNGVDASKAIDSGDYRLWYPDGGGREGLFINLQSLSVRAFGHEPWALRLMAAIVGAGVVTGIFLLGYLMFPAPRGALTGAAAAAMAGFGYWHLALSRLGLRVTMVGLVVVWFLVLLLAALRRYRRPIETRQGQWRRYAWWAAAGAIFGVGLHTYPAFRGAGLILLAAIAGSYRLVGNRRDWALGWAAFAVGGLVTASPMLIHFLQHPEHLRSRQEVAVWNAPDPWGAWWDSIKKTALMFTGPGDCNPRHNFPCRAELHPATAGLAGLGLIACLADLFRRPRADWPRFYSALPLVGLLALLLPVTLTFENLPHALRALGAAPFAYLLAGVGAAVLGQWLYGLRTAAVLRAAAAAALLAAILWAATDDTRLYFDEWPKRADVGPAFSLPLVQQARFLESRPGRHYVVYEPDEERSPRREDGLSVGAGVSQFLLWDEWRAGRLVYVLRQDAPGLDVDKPAIVGTIPGEVDEADSLIAELESRYRDGSVISDDDGQRYFVR
jgi:hypothetical protein